MSSSISDHLVRIFTVNPRMIPAKLAYILYGGILGLHMPYINIFFTACGLSKSQAGFISGIRYGSSAVAGPLWGMLADYSRRRKLVMVAICLGSAFPLFAMPWIAKAIHPVVNYKCSNVTQHNVTNALADICETAQQREITTLFYVFLFITVFGSVFVMSMPGYVDSIVINVVKSGQKEASYGAQRIFGSAGFTAANFLGGFVSDHYHHVGLSQYTAVFLMYLPACLLLIPIGCYLVGQVNWDTEKAVEEMERPSHAEKTDITQKGGVYEEKDSIAWKVLLLLRRFDVSFFMMTVFISGFANSLYISFSYILVKEVMHVSKTQMTFVASTGSASELLVFPFSLKIIQKVGTTPCIILGIFSYLIRFLSMSYATEFWVVVVTQLLHGLGFALAWSAMMEHTHKLASSDISVTVFNMMCAIFYSFSALVANMLGGVLYDHYGGKQLFKYIAVLCGTWTLLMLVYHGGKYMRNKHSSKFDNSIRYQASKDDNNHMTKNMDGITGIENPLGVTSDE